MVKNIVQEYRSEKENTSGSVEEECIIEPFVIAIAGNIEDNKYIGAER